MKIINQKVLTPAEGMYLTNGESVAKTVVLPQTADVSVWTEITEEEALGLQEVENG